MHGHRSLPRGEEDLRDQSGVLGLILAEYPALFTQADDDGTHRAVRDVAGVPFVAI
jgi:hypothetical protein